MPQFNSISIVASYCLTFSFLFQPIKGLLTALCHAKINRTFTISRSTHSSIIGINNINMRPFTIPPPFQLHPINTCSSVKWLLILSLNNNNNNSARCYYQLDWIIIKVHLLALLSNKNFLRTVPLSLSIFLWLNLLYGNKLFFNLFVRYSVECRQNKYKYKYFFK
jgi:hypothetical protein